MQKEESYIYDLKRSLYELFEKCHFKENSIFILGASTSEIQGCNIGKKTNIEIARLVVEVIRDFLINKNVNLSVQCCEHLNRAIVVEKEVAISNGLEIVSVIPQPNAGGGVATAAFELFSNPVLVEKITAEGGIDIGDTSIGMHVKHVQIPVRLSIDKIGNAHLTCLYSRPKLIGGSRAVYWKN